MFLWVPVLGKLPHFATIVFPVYSYFLEVDFVNLIGSSPSIPITPLMCFKYIHSILFTLWGIVVLQLCTVLSSYGIMNP